MQNNIIVKGDYLLALVNELKKKCRDLENIKDNKILPTLKKYSTIETDNPMQLDKITDIGKQLAEVENDLRDLTARLESTIIPGYQETSQSIKKAFNIDFHNEIDDLIGKIKTE